MLTEPTAANECLNHFASGEFSIVLQQLAGGGETAPQSRYRVHGKIFTYRMCVRNLLQYSVLSGVSIFRFT